ATRVTSRARRLLRGSLRYLARCAPGSCALFFLILRRPPRSPLFPYTRSSDLHPLSVPRRYRWAARSPTESRCSRCSRASSRPARSEEHTSELQSRSDLVCRLLLEKKNQEMCRLRRGTRPWAASAFLHCQRPSP